MPKQYDFAVFIGRFSPLHNGHITVINKALEVAETVIIILGSANSPRSYRNPFTVEERRSMIRGAFPDVIDRMIVQSTEDTIYNDNAWVQRIQEIVGYYQKEGDKITLIGHEKDNTSFYLKLFPQWDNVSVENVKGINSTDIRERFFSNNSLFISTNLIPVTVQKFLLNFSYNESYTNIVEEYEFVKNYKKSWDAAPYPPIFSTVDACVIQSGHILLVQRKARPGKGLWALPGGFLNQYEKIEDAVIRELREETKIKVPAPVLRGNIVTSKVFDDPHRSSRGRTITHAYLIHLPPDTSLPKVKGSDDAAYAKWFPLAEVRRNMMFEDHYDMIEYLTAML